MLTKTITYTDYNGDTRTEDFQFNINRAELAEMYSDGESYDELIRKIIETKDKPRLIKIFKELVLKSYGIKSLDGRRFIKTDDNGIPLYKQFEETEAFVELYMELATDAEAAADFVNGIIPNKMIKEDK